MQHIQTQSPARTLLLLALLAAAALLCVATSASPPVIDRITPGLGSSSVPVDQPLEIELERPADPDTVSHESVRLRRLVDDALVVATVELTDGNHRIVLGPDAPLDPETDYALELDLARLRDHDGNAYAGLRYDESLRNGEDFHLMAELLARGGTRKQQDERSRQEHGDRGRRWRALRFSSRQAVPVHGSSHPLISSSSSEAVRLSSLRSRVLRSGKNSSTTCRVFPSAATPTR